MAQSWSRTSMPTPAEHRSSSTTLLLRRLPPEALARALPVLALARDSGSLRCAADGTVYVLVDVGAASDDEPLAAALAAAASPERDVVLAALAVVPSCRGRGLGARLLAEVVDDLRADGALAVWAPIRVGEADAAGDNACRRLFLRRGFRPSGAPPGRRPATGVEWVFLEL